MNPFRLTLEQEEVVALREGCYLVLAPPGAGKTEIIAQRVVRLLQEPPDGSYRVLALTFNNRAAAAMRRRVSDRLGDESWRATIETYHAFYLDVLRHYGMAIGIPPEVTVYDTVDARIQALAQGLEEDGFIMRGGELARIDAEELLNEISSLSRSLIPPNAAPDRRMIGGLSVRDAYAAYDGVLRRNGAVDFDGMLTRAYELLTEHPKVAEHYRRIYQFILVDEAQDTSRIQFELLRALCGDQHRNVFMVADPDQLINRWLGADRRNLERFRDDFNAREFRLTANFRCADEIVRVANALVSETDASGFQEVAALGSAKGSVTCWSFPTEESEAKAIVEWATSTCDHGLRAEWLAPQESTGVDPEEVAILSRSRVHLRYLLAELDRRHEPYMFRAGETGPFDADLYKAVLDAIKVLANPRDVAMRRTLLASLPGTSEMNSEALEGLVNLEPGAFLREAAGRNDGASIGHLLDGLAQSLGIDAAAAILATPVPEEGEDSDLGELLRADRQLLQERLERYQLSTESRNWSWSGAVMSLVEEPRADIGGLRVSTVHAAKGLEFKAVAVIGMNDGSFPDFRSVDSPEDEASERRLAYVAVTRAARALVLSRPRSRITRFGTSRPQEESRFVEMMGLTMDPQ
jgi:DNA helicase-2/ATP-dependent DNA helicase PcrA